MSTGKVISNQIQTEFRERSAYQSCILTDGQVGMIVIWNQQYSNTLDNSGLFVREYNGGLIFNSEMGRRAQIGRRSKFLKLSTNPSCLARENMAGSGVATPQSSLLRRRSPQNVSCNSLIWWTVVRGERSRNRAGPRGAGGLSSPAERDGRRKPSDSSLGKQIAKTHSSLPKACAQA